MSFVAGVVCDNCGQSLFYEHTGKTHIARRIRELGWSSTRKNHCDVNYCPACRKIIKESKRGARK